MKITALTTAAEVKVGDVCDINATRTLKTVIEIQDTKAQRKITFIDGEGRESSVRRGYNTTVIKMN